MAIEDDFSVAPDGAIRYTGGGTNYPGIELYRMLGSLMAQSESSGDDILDISSITAAERKTDTLIILNSPYNIDDDASQHLYDVSIIQNDGDDIYDGIVVFAPQGTYVDVIQNGALLTNFWTTGLNANSAQGISHRFLIKTRSGGADIDGRRLLGTSREFGSTYAEFPVNGTERGKNVISLSPSTDLNNQTAAGTVATWTTITNTEGYQLIDVDNDTVDEAYYSQWNRDSYTINQLFERVKWITRRGSSETIYGLNGALFRGITHEIDIDTPTGTFNAVEAVSWAGGTGQMLAIDSTTAGTKMWIQLLTGVAPTDGQTITGGTSSATADVNITVTARSISQPSLGASTGSALIGGYGIGVETTDLSSADKLFDLTDTQRLPPNNVTFNVTSVAVGDSILVGPSSVGVLQEDQFGLNTTLSGASETSVVVDSAIPSDTPTSGTIRVQLDGGRYRRVAYTGFSGSTFTISSTDFSGDNATAGNNVYISYIDKVAGSTTESFTVVYLSDRDLFVRVRKGSPSPIQTFEQTGTLGVTGGSVGAIRTADE